MSFSRNEIAALVTRAARGAGVALGHAEDFGAAVAQLPTAADFESVLGQLDGPFDVTVAEGPPLQLRGPIIMILPMAIDAILAGEQTVVVGAQGALAQAYLSRAKASTGSEMMLANGVLRFADAADHPLASGPIDLPKDVVSYLTYFAKATYVPASEASRLSGAGAGLTDND